VRRLAAALRLIITGQTRRKYRRPQIATQCISAPSQPRRALIYPNFPTRPCIYS